MKKARTRSGFALILVLIAVAIAVVLGTSYVTSASIKTASTRNFLNASRAKYLAESGVQHAVYMLKENPSLLTGTDVNHPRGPYQADNTGERYVFWATPDVSNPGQYTLTASGTSGGITQRSSMKVLCIGDYANMVISANPMGYWRLGAASGTAIKDETGNYNGTINNAKVGVAGALPDSDKAVRFDGWGDWGNVDTADFQLKEDLTIVCWVKFDAFPLFSLFGDAMVASGDFGEGRRNNTLFQLGIKKGGDVSYKHECLWGYNQSYAYDTNLQTKQWYQITISRDAAAKQVKLYVNGQSAGVYTYMRDPEYGSDGELYFGIGTAPGLFSCLRGTLDDVAIFGKTMTQDQVYSLYLAGSQGEKYEVIRWNE